MRLGTRWGSVGFLPWFYCLEITKYLLNKYMKSSFRKLLWGKLISYLISHRLVSFLGFFLTTKNGILRH